MGYYDRRGEKIVRRDQNGCKTTPRIFVSIIQAQNRLILQDEVPELYGVRDAVVVNHATSLMDNRAVSVGEIRLIKRDIIPQTQTPTFFFNENDVYYYLLLV